MRLKPRARGGGGAGPVLEGLRPRHRARVPQADDRAARDASCSRSGRSWSTARATSTSRLREIFGELEPDVIVQDNVVGFPAVLASGRPWVRIVSCNPLELKDPALPPTFSGYPSGDRAGWDEFRARYRELHEPLQREFSAFCEERGAPPLPELEFIHESPFLEPLPLSRRGRLRALAAARPALAPARLVRALGGRALGAAVRARARCVYVSLGSLGSADVELMNRLVAALAETPHRYVVSKGPQHETDRARAEHDRRRVPAAAGDPAAGRPRDHARRQQHGHRVGPLRQADDRAAACSGISTTTRSASRRCGFGERLPTYEFEDARAARARSSGCSPPSGRGSARRRRASRRSPGTVKAADLIAGSSPASSARP